MSAGVDHHQQQQNPSSVAEQATVTSVPAAKQWGDSELSLRHAHQSDFQLVSGSGSTTDACLPSHYAPYISVGAAQGQPLGENIMWAATEPVTYIGGYDMSGNYISGGPIFRGLDYSQNLSCGWYPGVEYSEWNAGVVVGGNQTSTEGYYFVDGIGAENYLMINGDHTADVDVKAIQQSLDGMRLEDGQQQQLGYALSLMPSVGASSLGHDGASWMLTANQYSHLNKVPRAPQNGLDNGRWNAQLMWDGTIHPHSSVAPVVQSSSAAGTMPVKLEFDGSAHATYATADGSQRGLNFDLLHGSVGNIPNFGQYNPSEFSFNLENARFFIIKSYSEDDVYRSIKYNIWCSTEYGNKRLDAAYQESHGQGAVYLFFSVNGSGHFCGIAEMTSSVDYDATSTIWAQSKWKGQFEVRWIYVKDVPNSQLRHIKLENNENKPVTNSRDTQEVPPEKGKQVMHIIHQYHHATSIFDDFSHYKQRQEDERKNKENYRK